MSDSPDAPIPASPTPAATPTPASAAQPTPSPAPGQGQGSNPSPGPSPAAAAPAVVQGPYVVERDFAGRQYIGQRHNQEDYYAFSDISEPKEPPITKLLMGLGDGLGAHLGGNIASHHVVHKFVQKFKTVNLPLGWRLRVSLEYANESLFQLSSRIQLDSPPMGTTFLGCIVSERKLWWISVGDSPLYHFREGKLTRMNVDHSLTPILEERVRMGEITAEEAEVHPDRHVLQSACLGLPLTLVDSRMDPYALQKGDIIIAASDGILTLSHDQMQEMLTFGRNTTAGKTADALMFAIRCADSFRQDNVTLMVVKVP